MNAPMRQNETLPAKSCDLPDAWVSRIFERLESLYGARFHDLWKDTDIENVKRTWAEKLGGFSDKPEALKAALDACDDRPFAPNLPEFLGLCRDASKRKGTATLALAAPTMSRTEAEKRLKDLTAGQLYGEAPQPMAWAERLRAKYLAGEPLIPVQIRLASEALGEKWTNREVRKNESAIDL